MPTILTSPFARGNWIGRGKPGCTECRKGLTKAAQRRPRRRAVKEKRASAVASD